MSVQKSLEDLSTNISIPHDHKCYLKRLRDSGYEPRVVYDIGSLVLHWTSYAQTLWPNAVFILFDAFEPVEFMYKDYAYHIGVLSDKTGRKVKWYENERMPGGNSYYKERDDYWFPPNKYLERETECLDDVVQRYNFPPPDFVKMDVQGCELDIMKGGEKTFETVTDLIVEMQHEEYNLGAPNVKETTEYLEGKGFEYVDFFCDNGPDGDYHFKRK